MRTTAERFWSKVGPETDAGCRLWEAGVLKDGYGSFFYKGATALAHRVAWELTNGPIPAGMHVLHRCDTPPCVNPDHLFLGTNADNMADKVRKGRTPHVRGERNGGSKLTKEQVLSIRSEYHAGNVTQRRLAAKYGISNQQVSRIICGKKWAHLSAQQKGDRP